jgi:hypothetical protein
MARESMNLTQEQWQEIQERAWGAPLDKTRINQRRISPEIVKNGDCMNKTEFEYSWELEARKRSGEIRWWAYEAINLRLTGRTYYRPDFAVVTQHQDPTGAWRETFQFHEVKGYAAKDDALVKFKVAAEAFPFAEFFMYRKRPQKEGGGWELMKHLNGASR